ncbi:MAG: universal stress protein [Hoeflea sp.]|uniref:universal stress protein n=1 Tax=Hoeflea sp. TaxID=1940281 RepID=UPI001DF5C134|nr:universal stress protein [Hoeflea sp.]MBU4528818.1 universal stress protein [Alphaproteobacteria bacterium]MBU4545855.1 universal stress protein [Alphaproteobacteria bacterium]MBU4549952.1 universal stress protein [Alphaproteobacteria bacterium]MBV1725949.1 universal stress protein [Hoeflea sp.]MBV1762674.1 universal stress protein [Hoeflea sp.]
MTSIILALVDGSAYSKSVCDHAAWSAARMEAGVDLLHVLDRPGARNSDLSGAITLGARTALLDELATLDEQRSKLLQQKGRAILDDARAIIEATGQKVVGAHLRQGEFVETVIEQEGSASMIMIGKRGEEADFASLRLGAHLERFIRASHKPVFVASRAFKPIDSVIVAYDGGASSQRLVDHIARNKLFAGLTIDVVTVGSRNRETEKAQENAKAILEGAGLSVETTIIAGQPEAVLADRVEQNGACLVAMGAYGHSRIRSFVLGSTTSEMLRSCKAPVVLMR